MTSGFIKVASPQVGEEEVAAVREVLLSGDYVSGKKVEEFEKRFAEYIGTDHAVAVNSGTAAIHIALQAIGIGKGDEVIVPPLTFFATVSAVLYVGAIPVFADIDLDDLCLSPVTAEKFITSRTKAILPVHLYGACAKIGAFLSLSKKYDIPIIEDCAQAHGTEYHGHKVGSFGKAGCFSFFATKHMTTGEGGMITTNDTHIASLCKKLRNHGMSGRDVHEYLGFNNRMTEIAAAMGLVQLQKLDALNKKRIENSVYILKKVQSLSWSHVPAITNNVKHTYFWCPIMVRQKSGKTIDELKEHLKKNKIGFRQRYQVPLFKQPVLKKFGLDYSEINLPNADKVAGKVLGLPNHPGLRPSDRDRIIDVLSIF